MYATLHKCSLNNELRPMLLNLKVKYKSNNKITNFIVQTCYLYHYLLIFIIYHFGHTTQAFKMYYLI